MIKLPDGPPVAQPGKITMSEDLKLYDRNFIGWLERRLKRAAGSAVRGVSAAPQRYSRVDVNQLLRGSLDRREIARLDALTFAR